MIKAVIGKNNVEVYQDDRKIASIWGDRIVNHAPYLPAEPFISVSQELSGFISFVHPDEIEQKKTEPK